MLKMQCVIDAFVLVDKIMSETVKNDNLVNELQKDDFVILLSDLENQMLSLHNEYSKFRSDLMKKGKMSQFTTTKKPFSTEKFFTTIYETMICSAKLSICRLWVTITTFKWNDLSLPKAEYTKLTEMQKLVETIVRD